MLHFGKPMGINDDEMEDMFMKDLQDDDNNIDFDFNEDVSPVAKNHFGSLDDFMDNFPAVNGQYVIIGYFTDAELKMQRRYVRNDNDVRLDDAIKRHANTQFARDYDKIRNQQDYKDMLAGISKKATVNFMIDKPVHLMKACCYNFQWRNSVAYTDRFLQHKADVTDLRRRSGFLEPDADITDDMKTNDWHFKSKYRSPYITPEEKEKKDGRVDVNTVITRINGKTKEKTDFFKHDSTGEIKLRQILSESDMAKYKIFYVQDKTPENPTGGQLELLDKDAYNLLKEGYKNVKETVETLYEDEKEYIENLKNIDDQYQYRELLCDGIMFVIGLSRGANENLQYVPFVRINDKLCKERYPWVDEKSLEKVIDDTLDDAFDLVQTWHATPQKYYDVQHITTD